MRILNENGIEITAPDLSLGKLVEEELLIARHEAVEAVEEKFHYETVAEYPNGGKDVVKVVDVPGVEAKDAWDEVENVLRYILYTEAELKIKAFEESRRQFSITEVLEMLLPKQINTMEVDNNTALRMKRFYPTFDSIVGQEVDKGFKFTYGDYLYETLQDKTVIQAHYAPGVGMESLYAKIDETHAGTMEDPIPYDGNMSLTNGLYYYQDGVMYLCNRDTGNPVYNALSELVGLYVEAVE